MHVYRMWKAAEHVGGDGDIGYCMSMVNEIDSLVTLFCASMDVDITKYTDSNVLWHTGNHVNMRSGPMKEYQPWEWVFMVAAGRALGRMMTSVEDWHDYVLRHIRDHQFTRSTISETGKL